jgi:uncharacterized membrane protein
MMGADDPYTKTQAPSALVTGSSSERQRLTSWTPFAIAILGLWLATSPFAFGFDSTGMAWSDVVSGALLIVLGLLSIAPERGWSRWAVAVVGMWLLFAPLVFSAPNPAAYVNGTFIGVLVISLAIIIPPIPGMREPPGGDIPPGWSFNPSSWLQRAPIITLALVSFLASRYLTAYQLGYIDHAWDPFFGDGTVNVLESEVSEAFPVPDAGLGALVYLLEALAGFLGGRDRWRTMPWAVLLFGVLVIPLGVVSITLVILQPVAVGYWCTLCLLTALLMVIMIPLAIPEVVAMLQYANRLRRNQRPFWSDFLRGGVVPDADTEAEPVTFRSPLGTQIGEMVRGIGVTLTLALSVIAGAWLLASPAVLDVEGGIANVNYLLGPLVIVVASIAMAEPARPVRFLNVLFGRVILGAPLVLGDVPTEQTVSNVVVGVALISLCLRRGAINERYGAWNDRIV